MNGTKYIKRENYEEIIAMMPTVDKWYREGGRSDWVKAIDSWFNEIKIFPVESVSR
jgi:hypothetical protein